MLSAVADHRGLPGLFFFLCVLLLWSFFQSGESCHTKWTQHDSMPTAPFGSIHFQFHSLVVMKLLWIRMMWFGLCQWEYHQMNLWDHWWWTPHTHAFLCWSVFQSGMLCPTHLTAAAATCWSASVTLSTFCPSSSSFWLFSYDHLLVIRGELPHEVNVTQQHADCSIWHSRSVQFLHVSFSKCVFFSIWNVEINKSSNFAHVTRLPSKHICDTEKEYSRSFLHAIKELIQQRVSFISHLLSTNLISIGFSCPHFYGT